MQHVVSSFRSTRPIIQTEKLELKLLIVTASTTLNRATPSHRFWTHNLSVAGSSPARPTLFLGFRRTLKVWTKLRTGYLLQLWELF